MNKKQSTKCEDDIEFICVVKDGKFVYYAVKYNGTNFDVNLDDIMICHFDDIEQSGRIGHHD
jgi:hypothetical protein